MGIDINNQGLYLNDAIKKILEEMDTLIVNNEILHKEEINLDEALGKVSMEEILSEEDMPGYRSSVMDGYALGESTKENTWKIVGESFPGKPFNDLLKKGDIFAAARFSAINGAKKTSELIPLCHNLSLNKITIDFEICESKESN